MASIKVLKRATYPCPTVV